MNISLVSSTKESFLCVELFRCLKDVSVYKITRLEELPNKKILLNLIFFDAALGMEEITQQIHLYQQKNQLVKWLIINSTEIQQSLQCLQLGASGVLNQVNEKTLQDCLQTISNGELYLESDFVQILALRQIKKTLLPFKQLTAREYDVFCMLAEDYSIQSIAEILSVTIKTAFNCQAQIRKKLGVKGQQQILKLAIKQGLVKGKVL